MGSGASAGVRAISKEVSALDAPDIVDHHYLNVRGQGPVVDELVPLRSDQVVKSPRTMQIDC